MTVKLSCAQCGKERAFEIESKGMDAGQTVRSLIESLGWIAQNNYPYCDIYCSRRCAE